MEEKRPPNQEEKIIGVFMCGRQRRKLTSILKVSAQKKNSVTLHHYREAEAAGNISAAVTAPILPLQNELITDSLRMN